MSDPFALAHPHAPITTRDEVAVGAEVALDARAAAGLAFRKVNVKEAFTLVDGAGRSVRASLTHLDADGARALVYEAMHGDTESPARVVLACAVLQRQRMLVVAQKSAELGAVRVQPLFTSRSVQADGLAHEKSHAWPGQAIKGARQCRRASVPEVTAPVTLAALLEGDAWRSARARLFLDDRAEAGDDAWRARPAEAVFGVVLVVGPEGGFAEHERRMLREAGASALRLGPRVLRAETAVFAGLTAVQYALGDLGPAR